MQVLDEENQILREFGIKEIQKYTDKGTELLEVDKRTKTLICKGLRLYRLEQLKKIKFELAPPKRGLFFGFFSRR